MTTTYSSIAQLINDQQIALGLTNADLAAALGYQHERVIALIKAEQLNMPLNKVVDLAEALSVDPRIVLSLAMQRSGSKEVFEVIKQIMDPMDLVPYEVNLIRHLRKLCGQQEVTPLVFDGRTVVAIVAA